MLISSSHELTPVYLPGAGAAEQLGGMLPGRSEARFIDWRRHKQTAAKAPGSAHTLQHRRPPTPTDAHTYAHLGGGGGEGGADSPV